MKRLTLVALAALGACRDFSDDLQRCVDAGRCGGSDGGLDGGVDAGCVAEPGEVCIESATAIALGAFRSVHAVVRDEVWVGGEGGTLFRCDSRGQLECQRAVLQTNEHLNRIRRDGRLLVIAGHEGRVIAFDRSDAGVQSVTVTGGAVLSAVPGTGGVIWASTSQSGIHKVTLSPLEVQSELLVDGGSDILFDLWSDGVRAALAIGAQADRSGVSWAWDGAAWVRSAPAGLTALRSVAGAGGNVYAAAARDDGLAPAVSLYRIDTLVNPPSFEAVLDGGGDLFGVWVSADGGRVFAVGPEGLFTRASGGGFRRVSVARLDGGLDLRAVHGLESGELYVAGGRQGTSEGHLLHLRFLP